jgi:hypothetical protein
MVGCARRVLVYGLLGSNRSTDSRVAFMNNRKLFISLHKVPGDHPNVIGGAKAQLFTRNSRGVTVNELFCCLFIARDQFVAFNLHTHFTHPSCFVSAIK